MIGTSSVLGDESLDADPKVPLVGAIRHSRSPASHQTIRLERGSHSSPEEGACVMELASMLAGEVFSDRPESVCPVIGAFLRTYNDVIDHERRQDLYAYAAKIVGSRSSPEVEQLRIAHLIACTSELAPGRHRRLPRWQRWLVMIACAGPAEQSAAHAVIAVGKPDDHRHATALQLVDELLAIGAPNIGTDAPHAPEPAALTQSA